VGIWLLEFALQSSWNYRIDARPGSLSVIPNLGGLSQALTGRSRIIGAEGKNIAVPSQETSLTREPYTWDAQMVMELSLSGIISHIWKSDI
jgi:hypothetical protein